MLSATVVLVAARGRLWGLLPHRLQLLLGFRVVRFALAALPLFALGLGVYYVEVSCFDANMYYVRPVNWVVLTFVGFVVNWYVFHERQAPKASSGLKFYAVAGVCAFVSNSLFLGLNAGLGIYYLLAQVIAGLIVGLPHYLSLDRGVFVSKTKPA